MLVLSKKRNTKFNLSYNQFTMLFSKRIILNEEKKRKTKSNKKSCFKSRFKSYFQSIGTFKMKMNQLKSMMNGHSLALIEFDLVAI